MPKHPRDNDEDDKRNSGEPSPVRIKTEPGLSSSPTPARMEVAQSIDAEAAEAVRKKVEDAHRRIILENYQGLTDEERRLYQSLYALPREHSIPRVKFELFQDSREITKKLITASTPSPDWLLDIQCRAMDSSTGKKNNKDIYPLRTALLGCLEQLDYKTNGHNNIRTLLRQPETQGFLTLAQHYYLQKFKIARQRALRALGIKEKSLSPFLTDAEQAAWILGRRKETELQKLMAYLYAPNIANRWLLSKWCQQAPPFLEDENYKQLIIRTRQVERPQPPSPAFDYPSLWPFFIDKDRHDSLFGPRVFDILEPGYFKGMQDAFERMIAMHQLPLNAERLRRLHDLSVSAVSTIYLDNTLGSREEIAKRYRGKGQLIATMPEN